MQLYLDLCTDISCNYAFLLQTQQIVSGSHSKRKGDTFYFTDIYFHQHLCITNTLLLIYLTFSMTYSWTKTKYVKDVVQKLSNWSRCLNHNSAKTTHDRIRMSVKVPEIQSIFVTKSNMAMCHRVLIMKVNNVIVWPTMVDPHGRSSRTGWHLKK